MVSDTKKGVVFSTFLTQPPPPPPLVMPQKSGFQGGEGGVPTKNSLGDAFIGQNNDNDNNNNNNNKATIRPLGVGDANRSKKAPNGMCLPIYALPAFDLTTCAAVVVCQLASWEQGWWQSHPPPPPPGTGQGACWFRHVGILVQGAKVRKHRSPCLDKPVSGQGATKQGIQSSHMPLCHQHMVIVWLGRGP